MANYSDNMQLKISADISNLKKQVKAIDGQFKSMRRTVDRQTTAFTKLNTTFIKTAQRLSSLYIMFQTAKTVINSLSFPIKEGMEFNLVVEDQVTALTALTVATSQNVTTTGRQISISEKYTMATKEAVETMDKLRKINELTPHTLAETAKIYKTIYAQAKQSGASIEQMVETTKLLSIASKAGGIEIDTLLKSVDSLGTGTYLTNSEFGKFATALGVSRSELQRLSALADGSAMEYFNSKLQDLNKKFDTMAIAISQAQNAWDTLTGQLSKPIFDAKKTGLKTFTDELKKLKDSSDTMKSLSRTTLKGSLLMVKGLTILAQGLVGIVQLFDTLSAKVKIVYIYIKELFVGMTNIFKFEWVDDLKQIATLTFEAFSALFKGVGKTLADEIGDTDYADRVKAQVTEVNKNLEQNRESYDTLVSSIGNVSDAVANDLLKSLEDLDEGFTKSMDVVKKVDEKLKDTEQTFKNFGLNWTKDNAKALKDYADQAQDVASKISVAFVNAFKGVEDAIVNFVKTGKLQFKDLINTILEGLLRIAIQKQILGPLANSLFGTVTTSPASAPVPSANGNSFVNGTIQPFATGGLVSSPTLFNFGKGQTGLMGEAGTEAIMPLQRINGKLGVNAVGAGGNVVINIQNNTGTSMEASMISESTGTNERGEQLKVVNIVMDGVYKNTGGIRDMLKGLK